MGKSQYRVIRCLIALTVGAIGLGSAIQASPAAAIEVPLPACQKVSDVAVRPDGPILVLVDGSLCAGGRPTVVQFDADGRIDKGFGAGGYATTPIDLNLPAGENLWPPHIALRPSGGLLVTGFDQIAAFSPDGSVDKTFGSQGILDVAAPASAGPFGISSAAVQPDGKILVFGETSNYGNDEPMAVARYLPSGQPDPGFGTGGTAEIELPAYPGGGPTYWGLDGDIAVAPGGLIYAGTTLAFPGDLRGHQYPAVIRMDDAGTLDPSYGPGAGGFAIGAPGFVDQDVSFEALHLEPKPDGRAILFGQKVTGLKPQISGVASTFDPTGIEVGQPRELATAPVAIDSKGRILGPGSGHDQYLNTDPAFEAIRYLPDGSRDSTFGLAGGSFRGYFGSGRSRAISIAETRDLAGYVVAGTTEVCDGKCRQAVALVKLDEAGEPVRDFGEYQGLTTLPAIDCPLGASAQFGSDWVTRQRCRTSGGSFRFKARLNKTAKRRPSLKLRVGGLAPRPVSADDASDELEKWKILNVKLPNKIRLRSPKRRNLLTVKRRGGPRVRLSRLRLKKQGRRYLLSLRIKGSVEKPTTIVIDFKRGALKPVKQRPRRIRLRFKATILQGGTPNPQRISREFTSVRLPRKR